MSWTHSALATLVGALATAVLLPGPLRSAPRAAAGSPVVPTPAEIPVASTPPAGVAPGIHAGTPAVSPRAIPFRWSQIESDDYRQYAANLRSIGCPERTLRDILRADLAEVFAKSGQAPAGRGEFWSANYARSAPLAESAAAVEAALASLAGPEMVPSPDLSFLPAAEARAVSEWRDRFEALEEELDRSGSDAESVADLAERRDREFAVLLAPEQREDYQLRHSHLADELRSSLLGFEVDADEFRRLFQALQGERDAVKEGRFESADEALRSVLGEERFARYEQARAPGFRDLLEGVMAAGQSYETALELSAAIAAARRTRETGDPAAPDLASIGAEIRSRLGQEMQVLFIEHVGRTGD